LIECSFVTDVRGWLLENEVHGVFWKIEENVSLH